MGLAMAMGVEWEPTAELWAGGSVADARTTPKLICAPFSFVWIQSLWLQDIFYFLGCRTFFIFLASGYFRMELG